MNPPRFTRPEIKRRVAAIKRIYIETEETRKARALLDDALELDGDCDTAELTLLLADSGVGKTRLVRTFIGDRDPMASLAPDGEVERGATNVPNTQASILYVSLPTPCTIKGMTEQILHNLGDGLAHRTSNTSTTNTIRITEVVAIRGIQLIVIDEFQHLIDADRDRLLKSAAQWLKHTLDATKVPVVCVGLPESDTILKKDSQLSRRTGKLIRMEPFRRDGDGFNKYRAFLQIYEDQLGFAEVSNLHGIATASAIFAATSGLVGRLKQLVLSAARVSMKRQDGPDAITAADLATAFDSLPIGGANPFVPQHRSSR